MASGLESAKLKLERAAEHIEALKLCICTYSTSEPYKIVKQPDGKETVSIVHPPPLEISVLAGEVIYQIRSAIDHLAFDLVKLNPNKITLPVNWFQKCEFPLLLKLPDGVAKPPVPQSHFSKTLPGITPYAFTFIESLQPYYARDTPNHLRLLAQLSNIDKHRYLNLTVTRFMYGETVFTHRGHSSSRLTVQDGAELEPLITPQQKSGAMNVQRSIATFVSFDEPVLGGAVTLTVENVLEACLNAVQSVIIPAFHEFLK